MKFSKIAAIMKREKIAILITDEDGMQWLSCGKAAGRKKRGGTEVKYQVCENCGAHLDYGEKCDCEENEK